MAAEIFSINLETNKPGSTPKSTAAIPSVMAGGFFFSLGEGRVGGEGRVWGGAGGGISGFSFPFQ